MFSFALLVVTGWNLALPFGAAPEDEEVMAWRHRAESELPAPIPQTRFLTAGGANLEHCRFHRLGPGDRDTRELRLRFTRVQSGARRDGFPVDATLADATAFEWTTLPLWYDARGRLVTTVTLPPPPAGTKERPGLREEFIVWRYLPATSELLGEWQREVGPSPPAASDLFGLPHAILVEKQLVYATYLRASAYMLCRAAPPAPPREALPGPPAGDGSSRPSGGTRQPAP